MNGSVITKKKLIERLIIVGAIVASIAAVMLGSKLYDYYLSVTYPKSNLYGTWVEQNVASYAASEFVLGPTGVTIDGGNDDALADVDINAVVFRWDGFGVYI